MSSERGHGKRLSLSLTRYSSSLELRIGRSGLGEGSSVGCVWGLGLIPRKASLFCRDPTDAWAMAKGPVSALCLYRGRLECRKNVRGLGHGSDPVRTLAIERKVSGFLRGSGNGDEPPTPRQQFL